MMAVIMTTHAHNPPMMPTSFKLCGMLTVECLEDRFHIFSLHFHNAFHLQPSSTDSWYTAG